MGDPTANTPLYVNFLTQSCVVDGNMTGGTIIPDGYERLLAKVEADKPCVCPIKHCLQGFQKREGLTIHFAVSRD